ncbi:DUF4279 domain-containing protein [Lysinibacillus sp. LZ02]|uniref:DUF4279 domain-containing protein n=1 Tax=Lysinibacillus sp. LZ02 TaxID=3420668 RepID=UPI003D3639EE
MEKDTAYIRFTLVADEWPVDEFTQKIGIQPTESYKLGDKYMRGYYERARFETVWELKTERMKINYEIGEDKAFFEKIMNQLRPHIELINEYKHQYKLTPLFFAHYSFYWAQTPGMRIEPEVIEFAHQIGAYIDVYIDKDPESYDEEVEIP